MTRVLALHRDRTFAAVVAGLLLLAGANLYWFRHDFAALGQQVVGAEDAEAERWQAWARHYSRLFGMLPPGSRIGVQLPGWHSSGVVLEQTREGMRAWRSAVLLRERPGVVLLVERPAAEELLASVPGTDPEQIWAMMKDRLYGRQITAWSDPDLEHLARGGYLAFLRAIDTRPQAADWKTIKRRLGER